MKCYNASTMQTVRRADGQLYQTLNTRRLRNASPLQTVLPEQRRLSVISIVIVAAIITLLALAVIANNAHAQTIGEPWCQIVSAPQPAFEGQCVQPRAYLPLIDAEALLPR